MRGGRRRRVEDHRCHPGCLCGRLPALGRAAFGHKDCKPDSRPNGLGRPVSIATKKRGASERPILGNPGGSSTTSASPMSATPNDSTRSRSTTFGSARLQDHLPTRRQEARGGGRSARSRRPAQRSRIRARSSRERVTATSFPRRVAQRRGLVERPGPGPQVEIVARTCRCRPAPGGEDRRPTAFSRFACRGSDRHGRRG
jgi:hypothetical protein